MNMIRDFKFAFRQLLKTPAFTISAATVLALGIGVNTAVFSLVNTLFFASASLREAARNGAAFFSGQERPEKISRIFLSDLSRRPRAEHGL